MSAALTGKVIVNARPEHQSQALTDALKANGAKVIQCPLLAIERLAIDNAPLKKQQVMNIDHYDQVIVISVNAADALMAALDVYWPQLPMGFTVWAVGQKTAKHLQNLSLSVKLPALGFDSESLLNESQLQAVSGQRILIVRGVGGRSLLYETLQSRGAAVEYLELYQRRWPLQAAMTIQQCCHEMDAIIITSGEMLLHYQTILERNLNKLNKLYECPLVVASKRIKQQAIALGFTCVVNADGADARQLVQAAAALFKVS